MTGYTPNDAFTSAEIYDLSDLVQGGANGDANTPIKALADQANYVKNRLRRWEGVKTITGDYTIDAVADLGQFISVNITANSLLILPDAGAVTVGTRVPIVTSIPTIKALTIRSQLNQLILDGSISWLTWDTKQSGIYMHDAEKLIFVSAGDHWLIENAIGNFYDYGEIIGARMQRGNTLIADGKTLFNRADVPRLALYIADTAASNAVVSDAVWLSQGDSNPVYKGCYSSGNGTSTLRLPDMRAMSVRFLDLGRGIDLNREYNYAGGYEADGNKSHSHGIHYEMNGTDGTANGKILYTGLEGNASGYDNSEIQASGNVEATVKNIGEIPLVKY